MTGARTGPRPVDRTPVDWSREPHEFGRLHDDGYVLSVPTLGISLEVDRLRRERHQLVAELLVRCTLAGAQTYDGILLTGTVNLSSLDARPKLARRLSELSAADDVPWHQLVEELATRIRADEREGQPAVLLRECLPPGPEAVTSVEGIALPLAHPTIPFGDGGTGKSLIALYIAGTFAARQIPVLYADWELDEAEQHDRLRRLFRGQMPDVFYARCERPLVAEADRLRRLICEHAIRYVIVDSVAYACDGPPEAAETAMAYWRAMRQLRVGSLHVAHTSKNAETNERTPFGSVFWANSARMTWHVRQATDDPTPGRIAVALTNRKSNLRALQPAVGLELVFTDEQIDVRRIDLADEPELAARLPLAQRIVALVRRGALPIGAIADALDEKEDSVSKAVRRAEGKIFTRRVGQGGVFEIGLLDRRTGR